LIKIKILSTGCKRCSNLEIIVKNLIKDNKYDILVEKVSDYQEFVKHGIIASPGLVVNEKVMSAGIIPEKELIIKWILQEINNGKNMNLKILGTGCQKCKQLEENTREAVKQTGNDATIEKVTELKDIMNYGVMMTPALVLDEKVISVGKVLNVEEIKKIIS